MFSLMARLDDQFRAAVRAYLTQRGISGRHFGRKALGDPGFVASLDRGRRIGLRTADRVLAFMGEPTIGPAFRREVEAFLCRRGAKPYVLGQETTGDFSFVSRLRKGGSIRLETVDRVRDWMCARADEACLRAMRGAVAGVPLLAPHADAVAPLRVRIPAAPALTQSGETSMKNDEDTYLSTRQAAAYLGLSPRTLDRYRVSGEGPDFHRFGGRILYRKTDIEHWAAERRVSSASEEDIASRRAA